MQGPNPEEIKNIFSKVAHGYDKANNAMTFGLAHHWRRKLVRWSGVKKGAKVLDCATGTGDLALEFKRKVGPIGEVIGTDFCAGMLDKAPQKAVRAGLEIKFQLADVMRLPFADNAFDVSGIAYGIRNVADPQAAIRELARVVHPGGYVMILETGDAPNAALKTAFDLYFTKVVPRVGGWITGQRFAYEYLNKSSRNFPSRERFMDLMRATGAFSHCECKVLMAGGSFAYRGLVK